MNCRFLIVFDKLPIDKASVKSGRNSPEVIVACRCVNVGLFISGNLRRNVEVNISSFTNDSLDVITFSGETIRRVSPDERSISFFLLKAKQTLEKLGENSKRIMDNGIIVRKSSLTVLFKEWSPVNVYVSNSELGDSFDHSNISPNGVFIYETKRGILNELDLYSKIILPRPPHPERFIHDINILVHDHEETFIIIDSD